MLTTVSLLIYGGAVVVYALMWWRSARVLRLLGPATIIAGTLVNIYQLVSRWVEANQPPFKTIYETLVLLAICIAVVYVVIEMIYRARILGVLSALGCAFTMLYALSRFDKEVVNLPPALQSGWFIPHVVVYFFGYAALFVAATAALVYLMRPKPIYIKRRDLIQGGVIDLEIALDGAVRFGFAMLTIGLLIGGVWAREAWGDYWTWDPKETWSLATWLVFATYLHGHHLGRWRGRRLAITVLIGFGVVMFTYLGMHLLPTAGQSVHVYQ